MRTPYLAVSDIQVAFPPGYTQTTGFHYSFQHAVLVTAAEHAIVSLASAQPARVVRELAQ